MGKEVGVSSSFPLASILTIIFVLAKLMGKVSWSWWWVFSPLWIGTLAVLVILAVVFVIAVLAEIIK
jgi:hypothetical protein